MPAITFDRIRDLAVREVSKTPKEYPVGSNYQKYGAWYGWNGVAWCAQFQCWLFAQAGDLDYLYGKTASVWVLADRFKAHNKWGTYAKLGALAVFHGYSHVELVVGIPDADTVETVGGNTSWGGVGSLANGVYVARNVRSRSLIMGYCYPEYDYYVPMFNVLAVDGEFGPLTVKALQRLLNHDLGGGVCIVDGVFGPKTKAALQRWINRTGLFDNADDVRALQRKINAPVDGVWGDVTTATLQRYLNLHRTYLVKGTP